MWKKKSRKGREAQNEVSVAVINDILDSFETNTFGVSLVDGCAGTGKTVLAISMINSLVNAVNIDDDILKDEFREIEEDIDVSKRQVLMRLKNYIVNQRNKKTSKIGLVFPMPGIRETVAKVFKESGNGLVKEMVIGPSDVVKDDYDFLIFDDVDYLVETVRKKDKEMGLCKTVAGFSWEWKTKQKKKPKDTMECYDTLVKAGEFDILIENHKYIWNLTNEDWISRLDSRYTIGCIHTSQGYDMNYVGVIFGEEIDYDPGTNSIVVDLSKYMDKKVKAGTDESVLKELIINTYTTILARGIKGCYVYACNRSLRKYLKEYIATANEETIKGN